MARRSSEQKPINRGLRHLYILAILAAVALAVLSFDSRAGTSVASPFHPTPRGALVKPPSWRNLLRHRVTANHRPAPPAAAARRSRSTAVGSPGGPLFSFAVVSDTHDHRICRIKQGRLMGEALKIIKRRRPAFVVGVGDLIAGGGDCKKRGRKSRRQAVDHQLAELRRVLLQRLPVPFVPVAGNHDLSSYGSSDPDYSRQVWRTFWRANIEHAVPAVLRADRGESFRFTYRGVGIAVIGYYGTDGLHADELAWVRANVRPGDLVFRHVNPFGISCISSRHCGIAMTDEGVAKYGQLVQLLKERHARALFSGHTHAFYEGDCDGLRFINTGSLGKRSMEYLRGWRRSPYRKRQAFVWVDVYRGGKMRVTFQVWDPDHDRFEVFDPKQFPKVIKTKRVKRRGQRIGVAATCVSRRS